MLWAATECRLSRVLVWWTRVGWLHASNTPAAEQLGAIQPNEIHRFVQPAGAPASFPATSGVSDKVVAW